MEFLKTIFLVSMLSAIAVAKEPPSILQTAAYNFSARTESDPWNVFTDLEFNYWQASQDNMELGLLNGGFIPAFGGTGSSVTSITTSNVEHFIDMDFAFKPGFSVGMGVNVDYDRWDVYGKYTWFHCVNTEQKSVGQFVLFSPYTQNIAPTWGSFLDSAVAERYEIATENWRLNMDIADLEAGRWYYVGKKLTFHPTFGARAAWIEQDLHVAYRNGFSTYPVDLPGLLGEGVLLEDKNVYGKSRSWGTGFKASLETNWLFDWGFRVFAAVEGDLLFTRYTSLRTKTITSGNVVGIIDFISFNFALNDTTSGVQKNTNCLRAHLDLNLGINWGMYVHKSQYLDCSAGYEFQVFFDQNMFRHNPTNPATVLPNGNLYLQGLISKVRFDF